MFKEIATLVSDKCVDPSTKRPYTVTMIEQSMKNAHFSINPNKTAKQQAIEVIKLLQSSGTLQIERAEMKVRLDIPLKESKKLKEKVYKLIKNMESEEFTANSLEILCTIDPGKYREIDELMNQETKGKAQIEVLSFKETAEGEEKWD
jgi:ribosome maturation protein SDO1